MHLRVEVVGQSHTASSFLVRVGSVGLLFAIAVSHVISLPDEIILSSPGWTTFLEWYRDG